MPLPVTDVVDYAEDNGVAVVTMNRPRVRNAANLAMAQALAAIVDHVDADPTIRVVVLTGAGGTFCSGMDLKAFAAGERAAVSGRGFAGFTARPPQVPVVAAVEGAAVAGGFELVLACDLVVCAEDARFGLPEVSRGLVAAGGGLLRLPERVPRALAMEVIFTGDPFGADRAAAMGLVNVVTAPGQALSGALLLARRIAANGPMAVRVSKAIVLQSSSWSPVDAYAEQLAVAAPVFASADAKEGASAFTEKRTPIWRGL